MKYKLVIFDFDGTLADSFPWFLEVMNKIADKFRFKRIEMEKLDQVRAMENRALIRHLGVPFWKLPMIAREMRALASVNSHRIPLFSGTEPLLKQLHENQFKIAIVSSNSAENILKILGDDCSKYVHFLECGASLFGKQVQLRRVLKKSKISPTEAIYIGDETRDVEAAHKENISSGVVAWGYAKLTTLEGMSPTMVFHRMEDIPKALS